MYWVDIQLAQRKGLKFCQTRSNAIILYDTLPAYCIPKVVRMETGEVIYEKVYASPRPLPKFSLKHDWKRESGSEVALQAEVSQPTQPNPNHYERRDKLFALRERPVRVIRKSKHVLIVFARTLILREMQIIIERGDPLFALRERSTQVITTRLKHILFMTVRASI